jgi:hypothetical protein
MQRWLYRLDRPESQAPAPCRRQIAKCAKELTDAISGFKTSIKT